MCTRYVSPEEAAIERAWSIVERNPWRGGGETNLFGQAPFIRAQREEARRSAEQVVGQWSLVPDFETVPRPKYATYNARYEGITKRPSFRSSWTSGKRCIVPAEAYYEPCWETGEHVPWKFRRADGALWALAGLWNTWHDREHDTYLESFTMLTINADEHPLMCRMHRPDPKRPPDKQDKRMVVPIETADVDQWLYGSVQEATQLIRMAPAEIYIGEPMPLPPKLPKPPRSVRAQLADKPTNQGELF